MKAEFENKWFSPAETETTLVSKWSVLLVESNPDDASRVEELVRQECPSPFELHRAESLEAAMTGLALGEAHLVLLNLNLRDSQGLPTFEKVRRFFSEVPIIALSERESEALAREIRQGGAQDFLVKDRLDAYWLTRAMRSAIERHVAEEKLRASRAMYSSLVEQLPHGIFRKDLHGHFTFANQPFCDLVGKRRQEVVRKTSAGIFPAALASKCRAQDLEVIRTGANYEEVVEIEAADGQQRYLRMIKTPITDRKGRIVGVQGLLLDFTEHRKAESVVRASQELLQSVLDNTTAVIYIKDQQGKYMVINRQYENLFQITRQELIGKTDYHLFPKDAADTLRANDLQVLEAEKPLEFEEYVPQADGMHAYISIKFPLFDAANQPYAVCGISTDITERQQAQRALQESQDRLALVIQGSNDGIWDWNIITNEVFFSARWKSMLGYEERDIENTFAAWENLLHPDDRARALATVKAYFDGQTPTYELEHRLRHKDGTYRWILARGVALRDAAGQPLRMAGSHVDLTERKRAEQRSLAQYAITRVLAESATLREAAPKLLQVICETLAWDYGEIWLLDRQGEKLRCCGLWHVPTPELSEFGLASQQYTFTRGVGLPGCVWASGESAWIPDILEETDLPRAALWKKAGLRGGFGFPVRCQEEFLGAIEFFSREIRPPDEDLLRMFVAVGSQVGQFIARKQAEESRERLSAIVEGSDDAIFSEDLNGLITSWNAGAEKIFGYAASEVVGQPVRLLMPDARAEELAKLQAKVMALESVNNFETVRLSKRRTPIYVSLTLSAIKDLAGTVIGIATIGRDITERRRAQERLHAYAARVEQSNRDLLNFASFASHDLQEPLGKVQAFADLLQTECTGVLSDKGLDYLRRLRNATARMQDLINGLLSYSRVHSQAQPFASVDLNVVAREVLGDLEKQVKQTGARVEVRPLCTLEADPTQMRQLLQNLISNALKFVRPGVAPAVIIQACLVKEPVKSAALGTSSELCRLTIQDNGIGIPEKYLQQVFGMFQRLNKPHEYPGSGIGLAICRRIMQRHGGSIVAQSSVGQGSTFIIELPVRQRKGDTTL